MVKKSVLFGGKRPVEAVVERGRVLGSGGEGTVFEVRVSIERRGRKKTLVLAEKRFLRSDFKSNAFGDPVRQFTIMNRLLELNRRERLGLHILPTIRLRKIGANEYSLIITRYNELDWHRLSREDKERILRQMTREQAILSKKGYLWDPDMWAIVKDPKTGKPTAFIADFGGIWPRWERGDKQPMRPEI